MHLLKQRYRRRDRSVESVSRRHLDARDSDTGGIRGGRKLLRAFASSDFQDGNNSREIEYSNSQW